MFRVTNIFINWLIYEQFIQILFDIAVGFSRFYYTPDPICLVRLRPWDSNLGA